MSRSGETLRQPPQLAKNLRVVRRGLSQRTRPSWGVVVGIVLLLVGLPVGLTSAAPVAPAGGALLARADPQLYSAPPTSSASIFTATLHILLGQGVEKTQREFWGVNIQPYASIKSNISTFLNGTPIHFARWPGGSIGDDFNYTTNKVTWPTGGGYIPPFWTSGFIAWCRSVNCVSDFALPGEINSSATAAYYVRYVENTLGFHPTYWEIGNEPALWSHYNIPWSNWGHHTNRSWITPMGYALLVQRYVTAIHKVDPKARIIGLPGVGTGAYREPLWIADTVQVNGPNLTGVSIHVYPAGFAMDKNGTLPHFYATLNRTGTLAHRAPLDEKAILKACPNCSHLQLFVTEAGSGSDLGGTIGGTIATAMGSFPQVPYIAALAIQGLNAGVGSVDFFCLDSRYPGALFNGSSGAFRPVATLFSQFLPHMQRDVFSINIVGAPPGVYGSVSRDSLTRVFSFLISNTNMTTSVQFPLRNTGLLNVGFGQELSWSANQSAPHTKTWAGLTPSSVVVPPESVMLVEIATVASLL